MDTLSIPKLSAIHGTLALPGSKSLSNRALLLAALAQGTTTLHNVLRSDDTQRMLEALQALGVALTEDGTTITVTGLGGAFKCPGEELTLFLGNAGTVMRPLTAALALSQGSFVLTGEERMCQRPIGPLVEGLKRLGLHLEYLNNDGYPPLRIVGGQVSARHIAIPGDTSSQFITALLMAAPLAGGLTIEVEGDLISKPYVEMTLRLMARFGVQVERVGWRSFAVPATTYVSPGNFLVEGDASAATYFLAAAAIAGEITVEGLGAHSVQGDAAFVDVLAQMGAQVEVKEHSITVHQAPQGLQGIDLDMNDMPDAAMTLVPLALFTKGPVVVRNVGSWRVKETDRLAALSTEMAKLGVKVDCGADYIAVDGSVRNAAYPTFATYNDHRMAMALSLCAFDRPVVIADPKCTHKTYPQFFTDFLSRCTQA